jgi:hypothetical protein
MFIMDNETLGLLFKYTFSHKMSVNYIINLFNANPKLIKH